MGAVALARWRPIRYFAQAMEVNSPARIRFTELVVAIVVTVIGLVGAERMAWNQIATLRRDNDAFVKTLQSEDAAAAHRFIATSNRALTQLQRFLFVTLLGVLAGGAAIILLAYRR